MHSSPGMAGGYSKEDYERSAARKDDFFASKMAQNAARPDHLPPSQGGKYVGFGSTPSQPQSSSSGLDSNQARTAAPRCRALLRLPSASSSLTSYRTLFRDLTFNPHANVVSTPNCEQLYDEAWNTVSLGINKLSLAAGSVASVVKPGLAEVQQRYQRGELAGTAVSIAAAGADLGLRGLTNLKGLLKTAVTQLEGYSGGEGYGAGKCARPGEKTHFPLHVLAFFPPSFIAL